MSKFEQYLEEIYFTKQQKEEILKEERIYLDDILKLIDNKEVVQKILKYEEQSNILNEERLKLFYNQGLIDGSFEAR